MFERQPNQGANPEKKVEIAEKREKAEEKRRKERISNAVCKKKGVTENTDQNHCKIKVTSVLVESEVDFFLVF